MISQYFMGSLCPKRRALQLLLLIPTRADARGIGANPGRPAAVFVFRKCALVPR
jgi:hypothetical protein